MEDTIPQPFLEYKMIFKNFDYYIRIYKDVLNKYFAVIKFNDELFYTSHCYLLKECYGDVIDFCMKNEFSKNFEDNKELYLSQFFEKIK